MHLSLDTMSMVDDSCLSPSNFHDMGKGGGIAAGGRVHSIDVILGFSKDQEALLSPAGVPPPHKVDIDSLAEHEKQQEASSYSGHLSSLRNGGVDQQQQYHGESGLRCWGGDLLVPLGVSSCVVCTFSPRDHQLSPTITVAQIKSQKCEEFEHPVINLQSR